jgi:hypothetical protein
VVALNLLIEPLPAFLSKTPTLSPLAVGRSWLPRTATR